MHVPRPSAGYLLLLALVTLQLSKGADQNDSTSQMTPYTTEASSVPQKSGTSQPVRYTNEASSVPQKSSTSQLTRYTTEASRAPQKSGTSQPTRYTTEASNAPQSGSTSQPTRNATEASRAPRNGTVVPDVSVVKPGPRYHVRNHTTAPPMTDEQRLYRRLRVNYDPYTRPVYNASHPVVVKIGISLTQIFDLDEKNQVLTTNVWLDHEWTDEKMRWDPDEYNGLKVLRIPCKHIWKPDIVLYNSVEDYTDGYMQALAMVSHDGSVFWPPIVKFHSTCQIDITYFPFDDQVCFMKLGSWAYDGFQVDVVNRSSGMDLSNYVSNGEWQLLKVVAIRNVVYYPCCPEPFPDVRFIIFLRRRTLYYTYNVIMPCVMLSTLTLLVFWMSPDSGEKVTLGLTVLLAFSVFMLLIAENMPATSNFVPLIGIYLTSVMALTSMSVVLAVVVSNISNRGRKDKVMPSSLRSFIRGLARLVCYRLHHVKPPAPAATATSVITHGYTLTHGGGRSRPGILYKSVTNHVSNDSGCGLLDLETNIDFACGLPESVVGGQQQQQQTGSSSYPASSPSSSSEPPASSSSPTTATTFSTFFPQPADPSSSSSSNASSSSSSSAVALRAEFRRSRREQLEEKIGMASSAINNGCGSGGGGGGGGGGSSTSGAGSGGGYTDATAATSAASRAEMEDILSRLREVLVREEEKDNGENLCREWQEAAEVIDRFLFWIFVIGTILATITSLVILPLTKKPLNDEQFRS